MRSSLSHGAPFQGLYCSYTHRDFQTNFTTANETQRSRDGFRLFETHVHDYTRVLPILNFNTTSDLPEIQKPFMFARDIFTVFHRSFLVNNCARRADT